MPWAFIVAKQILLLIDFNSGNLLYEATYSNSLSQNVGYDYFCMRLQASQASLHQLNERAEKTSIQNISKPMIVVG